jgi:hypothetical protein
MEISLKQLNEFLDFAICNQKQLIEENKNYPYDWNKGYLEAMQDVKIFVKDGTYLGKNLENICLKNEEKSTYYDNVSKECIC